MDSWVGFLISLVGGVVLYRLLNQNSDNKKQVLTPTEGWSFENKYLNEYEKFCTKKRCFTKLLLEKLGKSDLSL